jgi:GntR family transcriptional repressor for pyruvate dehydrogenase complex
MTEDVVISVLSAATRIACGQLTPQQLDALYASVDQASALSARPDWGPKAAANVELFHVLGDAAGDGDLARLVSSAARRLHVLLLTLGPAADGIILGSRRRLLSHLRALDADGAAREMERHLRGLHYMGKLACGGSSPRIARAS